MTWQLFIFVVCPCCSILWLHRQTVGILTLTTCSSFPDDSFSLSPSRFFWYLNLRRRNWLEPLKIGAYLCIKPRESKNALHSVGSRPDQGTSLQLDVDWLPVELWAGSSCWHPAALPSWGRRESAWCHGRMWEHSCVLEWLTKLLR